MNDKMSWAEFKRLLPWFLVSMTICTVVLINAYTSLTITPDQLAAQAKISEARATELEALSPFAQALPSTMLSGAYSVAVVLGALSVSGLIVAAAFGFVSFAFTRVVQSGVTLLQEGSDGTQKITYLVAPDSLVGDHIVSRFGAGSTRTAGLQLASGGPVRGIIDGTASGDATGIGAVGPLVRPTDHLGRGPEATKPVSTTSTVRSPAPATAGTVIRPTGAKAITGPAASGAGTTADTQRTRLTKPD